MKKLLLAFVLFAASVYAAPVEVTQCPFLMESDTQYIVTQDMSCHTFPFTFIDLSNSPTNSSVNLNGHTIDVSQPPNSFTNFIGDFGTFYDIEVYGGNVINCGMDGGGCIQWGGSGAGILYLHDMNMTMIGNFITTSINELPGLQRLENVNIFHGGGSIITGWFLNLVTVNVTSTLIGPQPLTMSALSAVQSLEVASSSGSVFAVDGGDYSLTGFSHDGYADSSSNFDISGDGAGTNGIGRSVVTLENTDINPETECGNGCDLVTWIVNEEPEPAPILNITTTGDLIVQFKSGNDAVTCENCDGKNGAAVIQVSSSKVSPDGCAYISGFLSSVLAFDNTVKAVHIDKVICSDNSALSSMPILNLLHLVNPKNKESALFK